LNGGWDWLGQEQQVTLAVEHTSFTNEERFELFFSPDPFNILAPRYDQRISGLPAIFGTNVDEDFSETSVAGQLLLKTSDRLSFLLGARYDWIEWEIGNRNLLSAAPRTQTDISVDAFTPRASVLFGLTEDVNAYYSYSRGFIPGRLIDNFGKQADPERGNQHEIGLKADLLDGRVGAGLAVFQIDRQNVSILDPSVPPGQRRLITGREQRHQGIEIDLIGEVAPNLNLVFSYGYLEAEITRNVANPALVGRRPTRTFDHVGSIAAQYQVESGALAGLFFGGGVSYTGELPVNDANVFFFPSYWLANANVGYDITPKVRVLLNATNLFDETYFTTDGGSLVTQNFQGAPRAFRASLRVNF
jgi:iron complex outermembrane receptor protein